MPEPRQERRPPLDDHDTKLFVEVVERDGGRWLGLSRLEEPFGVLVAIDEDKDVRVHLELGVDEEVGALVPLRRHTPSLGRFVDGRALQKLAGQETRVGLPWLVDGDGVIDEEEGDDEPPLCILIRTSLGLELALPAHALALEVGLGHVATGDLGDQVVEGAERVLGCAVAGVRGRLHAREWCLLVLDGVRQVGDFCDSVLFGEELASGFVAAVEEEIAAEDGDRLPHAEVGVRDDFLRTHVRQRGVDLWELLPGKHARKVVTAGVSGFCLENLHSLVLEEVVNNEEPSLSMEGVPIIPRGVETEHLAVELKEAPTLVLGIEHRFPTRVGAFFALARVRVCRNSFTLGLRLPLLLEKLACEFVTVGDVDLTTVKVDDLADDEAMPVNNAKGVFDLMALQKAALGHSAVLDTRFSYTDGVIDEIIVHDTAADAVLFVWRVWR